MKDEVLAFIVKTVREVGEEQGLTLPADIGASTRLFGDGGALDSMALVSLVIAVEQGIEAKFGRRVELSDDKALSQRNSPYRTVGTLADYAVAELGGTAG